MNVQSGSDATARGASILPAPPPSDGDGGGGDSGSAHAEDEARPGDEPPPTPSSAGVHRLFEREEVYLVMRYVLGAAFPGPRGELVHRRPVERSSDDGAAVVPSHGTAVSSDGTPLR